MHIMLDGMTAFEYWRSSLSLPCPRVAKTITGQFTTFSGRERSELNKQLELRDELPGEMELLARNYTERGSLQQLIVHAWGDKPLPRSSIYEIGEGISVISPELTLVRIAPRLTRLELVRAANDLCSCYCHSYYDHTSLVPHDEPATSIKRIAAFTDSLSGVKGARPVRQVLAWTIENTASPRETTMAAGLVLPTKLGGQGLPHFEANLRIDLIDEVRATTTRSYLVGDAVWEDPGIVLEYNSDKYHMAFEEKLLDLEKITALQTMGMLVLPITTRQFNNYDALHAVVVRVREALKIRDRYSEAVEPKMLPRYSLSSTARWSWLLPRLGLG